MTGGLDRQESGVDANGGRRTTTAMAICEATLRHATMETTTEVGFPPLLPFFESFLEISLRFAKSRYGNRFRFSLFIEICFSCWGFKMVHGCACNVRGISVMENAFLVFWFSFLPCLQRL